jgi:hypothetical protein
MTQPAQSSGHEWADSAEELLRVVYIADNKSPGVHFGVYLEVQQLPEKE